MIRQMQYFQSVVRNHSFSEAAEECHISQSAVSQQVQSLEKELGVQLLQRKNRKFILTPAGEYFYKKSLVLVADYERLCTETAKIALGDEAVLHIGYLRGYNGKEFRCALDCFSSKFPDVSVKIEYGNHEELFEMLRTGKTDLVFNDQRRAFSNEYMNLVLDVKEICIEISARNPISTLKQVTLQDLKNTPCILVSSETQRISEERYYREVIGFQGEFLIAENLEEARLSVIGGGGFMISHETNDFFDTSIRCIPLYRDHVPIAQTYCAFWKKDNSGYYAEAFADTLKEQFETG